MQNLLRNDLAKFFMKNKKQLYQNEKSRLYHFLLRFLLSILRVAKFGNWVVPSAQIENCAALPDCTIKIAN